MTTPPPEPTYTEAEISEWSSVPRPRLKKAREALNLTGGPGRAIRHSLDETIALLKEAGIDLPEEDLRTALAELKMAAVEMIGIVQCSSWRNSRLMAVKLKNGPEVRIRVKDKGVWLAGKPVRVQRHADGSYTIAAGFGPNQVRRLEAELARGKRK